MQEEEFIFNTLENDFKGWQSWPAEQKKRLLERLLYDFDLWRLPQQEIPPDSEYRYYLNLSGRGGAKLLSIDTPILTTSGFKTMGTIEPGDTVFDERGNPTTVIHCSEIQYEPSFKITFSDNSVLYAHDGHQWVTLTHAERKKYIRSDRLNYNPNQPPLPLNWANKPPITTQEIINTFTHSARKDLNHCIPLTKPLQFPEQDLPLDPYILGYWLGDGSSSESAITVGPEDSEFFIHYMELLGSKVTKRKTSEGKAHLYKLEKNNGISLNPILKELNLIKNKHIPEIYLQASEKQRRHLLAGLLDSDGHASRDKKRAHFTNTNHRLIEQVNFLALSLGYKATITDRQGILYGIKKKMAWQVSFPAIDNPFILPRKYKIVDDQVGCAQRSRNHHRMITSIEPGPVIPMRCIMVDSPNSMYLAGTSLIPTHNTKLSSEEIRKRALAKPDTRINLIAPTHGDARDTNLEGDSGIISVCAPGEIKKYLKNQGQVIFSNGSRLLTFSAQEPERLRGKQSHYCFMDEFSSFEENTQEILTQVQMSNRLGNDPKVYITTTPKPSKILNALIARPDTHLVVSGTLNNPFLATTQVKELVERYANTAIGQQELFGQILTESKNANWSRAMIDDYRVTQEEVPDSLRIIIAIDPSSTNNRRSDECGMIVAGVSADKHFYVLRDLSIKTTPQLWANRAVTAYRQYNAALIAVEKSDGDLVKTILKNIDGTIPIRMLSHQKKGKTIRAEPVSQLYQQGRVHHVGYHKQLEDQLCSKVPGDSSSDDRHDALVYAIRELSNTGQGGAVISARQARANQTSSQDGRMQNIRRSQRGF